MTNNTLSFISLVGIYALCEDNDDTIVLAVGRIVYKTGSSDKLTERDRERQRETERDRERKRETERDRDSDLDLDLNLD